MDFSIIIPAKNEETQIGRCVESILNIRYPRGRFEVLLVDNGSSDGTAAIAAEKGAKVFSLPEKNISGLRNFGARQAQGDMLVFLDADCSVETNWLGEASRYLGKPGIVCFGSPPKVPEPATWVQKAWYQIRRKHREVSEVEWLESMNMFVRRDAFEAIGGFDERLVTCEDYDLCLRLTPLGKILSDGRIMAIHHGEAATISQFFRKERWRGTSNLRGVLCHGLKMREFPSLALPALYCALGLWFGAVFAAQWLFPGWMPLAVLLASLVAWQAPLALGALWKTHDKRKMVRAAQLYLLLNLYYLARGRALLPK